VHALIRKQWQHREDRRKLKTKYAFAIERVHKLSTDMGKDGETKHWPKFLNTHAGTRIKSIKSENVKWRKKSREIPWESSSKRDGRKREGQVAGNQERPRTVCRVIDCARDNRYRSRFLFVLELPAYVSSDAQELAR
jgi:hypothetical protein